MNENDFTDLMERARPLVSADVERLLSGGASRGRRSLRRRRAATVLGAGACMGIVATGVSLVAPSSIGRSDDESPAAASEAPSVSEPSDVYVPQPARPDRPLAVAAADMPAEVTKLADGDLGTVLQDERHPVVDEEQRRIVHFHWNGTLTTLVIEPAHLRASCEEQATPTPGTDRQGNQGAECLVVDGLDTLVWPADEVPTALAHGVSVWNHGYIVSAVSYTAADGKSPAGSEDVEPLMDGPALSIEELTDIAKSDVWFE